MLVRSIVRSRASAEPSMGWFDNFVNKLRSSHRIRRQFSGKIAPKHSTTPISSRAVHQKLGSTKFSTSRPIPQGNPTFTWDELCRSTHKTATSRNGIRLLGTSQSRTMLVNNQRCDESTTASHSNRSRRSCFFARDGHNSPRTFSHSSHRDDLFRCARTSLNKFTNNSSRCSIRHG